MLILLSQVCINLHLKIFRNITFINFNNKFKFINKLQGKKKVAQIPKKKVVGSVCWLCIIFYLRCIVFSELRRYCSHQQHVWYFLWPLLSSLLPCRQWDRCCSSPLKLQRSKDYVLSSQQRLWMANGLRLHQTISTDIKLRMHGEIHPETLHTSPSRWELTSVSPVTWDPSSP